MRPGLVVMADEVAQHMSQVPFVHDDDVVEALSAEGADQTFGDTPTREGCEDGLAEDRMGWRPKARGVGVDLT